MKLSLNKGENLFDESELEKPIRLIDIANFFWRWRKPLLYVCAIVFVLAIVFSHPIFIKPKYKATHIFYPTTNNSISNALMTELNQRQKDPLEFGEDEEAEKALQVLQSGDLMGRLIKNFNLYKHYGIDPKKGNPKTAIGNMIESNFSFTRTRYLSVKIDVLDEDPKMAADLANGIAALYDTIKTEIQKQIAVPALEIVRRAVKQKQDQITGIKDRMRTLGEGGITNYEEQSRALAEEIYKAQSLGRTEKVKELIKQQGELVKNGGDFIQLNELIKHEEEKESDLLAQLEKREVDVKETLSHKFTVSAAEVPEIKAWPKRTMMVIFATITAFAVCSLGLLIFEVFAQKKSKQGAESNLA